MSALRAPYAHDMIDRSSSSLVTRMRDGRAWRIGTDAEVAWIANGTSPGLEISSAIPLVFEAYATIVVPAWGQADARRDHDRLVVRLLAENASEQPWWLGYLDTGSEDVIFANAPMVTLYAGWRYVLIEAGPTQALAWRNDPRSERGPVPDLIFPGDRSWLVSRLWDDDWRCVGGDATLVDRFLSTAGLEARRVHPTEDATPPGHVAR